MRTVAAEHGLRFVAAEFTNLPFCEQIAYVAKAALLVGVFGAAIAAHFPLTRDEATTVEITACKHAKGKQQASDRFAVNTFHPMATQLAKGYVQFCLCVDDDRTDLAKFFASSRGWLKSKGLVVDAPALESTLRSVLQGEPRNASVAAQQTNCG